jgi:hypothetical protein
VNHGDPQADSQHAYDLELARLITNLKTRGATWTTIGRTTGKTRQQAKRDYKRAARRAGRTWRLQDNQQALDSPP